MSPGRVKWYRWALLNDEVESGISLWFPGRRDNTRGSDPFDLWRHLDEPAVDTEWFAIEGDL